MYDYECTLYQQEKISEPGNKQNYALKKFGAFYFGFKKIGIQRRALSMNMDESVDALIETHYDRMIDTSLICVIEEVQYKITFLQDGINEDGLKIMLLQLERLEVPYDFIIEKG